MGIKTGSTNEATFSRYAQCMAKVTIWASLLLVCTLGYALDREINYWPFYVERKDAVSEIPSNQQIAGPFLFRKELPNKSYQGFRPFYLHINSTEYAERNSYHILYPLYSKRDYGFGSQWTIFQLITGGEQREEDGTQILSQFEVFPFYFNYQTTSPEKNYRGLFPIYGEVKNRLLFQHFEWVLFPFYGKFHRTDEAKVFTPWPFFSRLQGPNSHGWALWPLYGNFEKEGVYTRKFVLWPIYYNVHEKLDTNLPTHRFGVLPFYATTTRPGLVSKTWVWPFFGYTKQDAPQVHERRYLWPLFTQMRGEQIYEDRFIPFYRHVEKPGYKHKVYAWPFWRSSELKVEGGRVEKGSILLFLIKKKKFIPDDPEVNIAGEVDFWPFFSYINDGQGQRQLGVLSPLRPFFPRNEMVRESWSKLFMLYYYDVDQQKVTHSLLWDAITLQHDPSGHRFNVGPLFHWQNESVYGKEFSLLSGALGYSSREESPKLSLLWFDIDLRKLKEGNVFDAINPILEMTAPTKEIPGPRGSLRRRK